ncbi:hypothetical protein SteCoe_21835 [Stentor coeruleus]|uniref:Uncharacterized protein n=1 Tax=Stentor coeruleus TaxID=5963 RepID=A0A1R2BP53_9CILI|nr:hypothetical protein SteCoe_21835 [Stentor coeruleus]
MTRHYKSNTPSRKDKQFELFGNIYESKMPEYDSFLDPHLSNYYLSRKKKKVRNDRLIQPALKIYNSNKSLYPLKPATRHKSPQFPNISKRQKQNIKPVSGAQFKQILQKYRDISIGTKDSLSKIGETAFITS